MRLTAAQALARAQRPQKLAEERPGGDLGVAALKLNRKRLSARVEEAILGADLERTLEGASTLTLTILDAERELFRTGFLELTLNARIQECTVTGRAERWAAPPGSPSRSRVRRKHHS